MNKYVVHEMQIKIIANANRVFYSQTVNTVNALCERVLCVMGDMCVSPGCVEGWGWDLWALPDCYFSGVHDRCLSRTTTFLDPN